MSYSSTSGRGLNRVVGYAFGAVYVLVGLLGFAVTGGADFAGREGGHLLGIFLVNPLANIVHVLVGVLLAAGASRGDAAAGRVNTLVGGVYLLLGVLGLFILSSDLNVLALNIADNLLHFASAALLLAVGLAGARAGTRSARA